MRQPETLLLAWHRATMAALTEDRRRGRVLDLAARLMI